MNWLAFWASVIGSLAWPATIIIVAMLFRKQLLAAAPWLRELEVGNVKVRFAEELAKAANAADAIPTQNAPLAVGPTVTDRDLVLAEHAPVGLVLESWMRVERALADASNKHGLSITTVMPRSIPSSRLINELVERRVITQATAQTINYLRQLRNQVAHQRGSIDSDQALEYARLAKKVLDALNEEPAEIPGVEVG